MSAKSLFALIVASVWLVGVPVAAQEEAEKPDEPQTFRLQRDSSTAEAELELGEDEVSFHRWVPAVKQGTIEIGFSLGFLGLNKTLLQHDQIVYKYTQEDTYFGDVELKGKTAFNPVVRVGGNISRWFALEGVGGLSFGEYESSITNRKRQKNEAGAPLEDDPPLGEYDAEKRSLLTGQASLNAVIYPLNFKDERVSHFQPYVTAGFGRVWYSMNSNYADKPASAWDTTVGGGFRILADRNISVRFEVLMRFHDLKWDAPGYFTTQDEGTVKVPLEDSSRTPVTEYDSNTMALFNWSIGMQGSF